MTDNPRRTPGASNRELTTSEPRARGALPPPPADGVVAGSHAPGPVGIAWQDTGAGDAGEGHDRLLRGRTFARRGRVRALSVAPGGATAQVVGDEICHPSLRVRAFSRGEWARIFEILRSDLGALGALLEGRLETPLIEALQARGLAIQPASHELTFDCDCGDYAMPCAHAAALHQVLVDAIDGDPFQLLTLRGRTRAQLLTEVQLGLGAVDSLSAPEVEEDLPPDPTWWASPVPVPSFACTLPDRVVSGAGLRALGQPPGEVDLQTALLPLYEAGAAAARAVLEATPAARGMGPAPPHVAAASTTAPAGTPPIISDIPATPCCLTSRSPPDATPDAPVPEPEPEQDRTELLVDALAAHDGLSAARLAELLVCSEGEVRADLRILGALGLVVSRGRGAGRRWHVG